MEKTIELEFKESGGYWRDEKKSSIPAESGVYLVYVCKYNEDTGKVTLEKLIYIGEAEDVNNRIPEHEKRECWEGEVPKGKQLCYSFASANKSDRERAEAALIFHHKPICNDRGKDSFNYDKTTVISKGRCALLDKKITVSRTN